MCLAFLISRSPISPIRHVSGKQESSLSVQTPYIYVVPGKDLSLDCIVNGSSLSVDRVSWKHDGKWLHNETQRSTSRVRLILRKISRQQDGLYQCGVFKPSGQSSLEAIPKEGNVTVFIGGYITKLMCTSNGKQFAPRLALSWNTIDDYHGVLEFTYSVWYCVKPASANYYCGRPPYNFSVYQNCSDMKGSSSTAGSEVVACNVTSLFMRLFPNLYDVHAPTVGRISLYFTIAVGNVHMPIIGSYSESVECSPLMKVRCTRPENIHLRSLKRKTLSLVWDAPKVDIIINVSPYYWLLIAEGGADKNKTIGPLVKSSHDFTSLRPYTLYHIYIACSKSRDDRDDRGHFIGPFSAMTMEEEPSDFPTILTNWTSTVTHKEYRNVTFTWMLPDKGTWHGILTRFILDYSTVSSSRGEDVESQLEVFNNASNYTATVTGLRLDEKYVVEVRMCTRVGCGPKSQPLYISSEIPSSEVTTIQASRKTGDSSFSLIIGLILGVVVVSVVFSVVMAILWTKRKHRSPVKRKPKLSEVVGDLAPPHSYDVPKEPDKDDDSGVYDETYTPLLSDKASDYVQITTSQPMLSVQRTSKQNVDDDKVADSTEI
ncbi:receptor-type tyrosine-protein phosphatase F-like [Porites lutea]|uniref:receptor-type tyrosine-protein phosphatase F-like n=1 Tax=Porites lutea TaxID=51062 RepID=UPI003CC65325